MTTPSQKYSANPGANDNQPNTSDEHAEIIKRAIEKISQHKKWSEVIQKLGFTTGGYNSLKFGTDNLFCGHIESIPHTSFYSVLQLLRLLGCLLLIDLEAPAIRKYPSACWITFSCNELRCHWLIEAVNGLDGCTITNIAERTYVLNVKREIDLISLCLNLENLAEKVREKLGGKAANK